MSLICFVTGQFKLDRVSVNSLSEAREDDLMSLQSEGVGVLGSAPPPPWCRLPNMPRHTLPSVTSLAVCKSGNRPQCIFGLANQPSRSLLGLTLAE